METTQSSSRQQEALHANKTLIINPSMRPIQRRSTRAAAPPQPLFDKFDLLPDDLPDALRRQVARQESSGWLRGCFINDDIAMRLIFRALLASKCQQDFNLEKYLDHLLENRNRLDCRFDEQSLRTAFGRMNKDGPNKNQRLLVKAISDLRSAYKAPTAVLGGLKDGMKEDKNWVRAAWFSASDNKKRMTEMERFGFQLQIALVMGVVKKEQIPDAKTYLAHAGASRIPEGSRKRSKICGNHSRVEEACCTRLGRLQPRYVRTIHWKPVAKTNHCRRHNKMKKNKKTKRTTRPL